MTGTRDGNARDGDESSGAGVNYGGTVGSAAGRSGKAGNEGTGEAAETVKEQLDRILPPDGLPGVDGAG